MTGRGSHEDDPPGGGGRSPTGPRRRSTERGFAPPTEDPEDAAPASEGPAPIARKARVTLEFAAPPLALPGEEEVGGKGDLVLDTDGMADAERSEPGSLDLDLAELEASDGDAPELDAWGRDRLRRGSGSHRVVSPPPSPPSPAPLDAPHSLPAEEGVDAIGLVDRSRPSTPALDLGAEMKDRYALGDFTGALRAAELLLGSRPDDAQAQRYAQSSRDRLVQLYSARLGPMDRVPQVAVPDSEVRWLGLDHRAGFLLSRVDGQHTLEEIIDVSGMARLEALKMLTELLDAGAIQLGDG